MNDTRSASVRRPRRSGLVLMDDARQGRFDRRFELAATVLLAMAAVATAWAAYQSARWRGEQARAAERIDRRPRRVDARGERGEPPDADRRRAVHAVGGRLRARRDRARRLLPQALPRRVPAGVQGLGRDQAAEEPRAPLSPFAMPQYKLAATRRPTASRRRPPRSPSASGTSSSGPTTTRWPVVLFAASLFFAGISTRLHARTPGWSCSGSATCCSSAAVIWIATFPVSGCPHSEAAGQGKITRNV